MQLIRLRHMYCPPFLTITELKGLVNKSLHYNKIYFFGRDNHQTYLWYVECLRKATQRGYGRRYPRDRHY